MNVIYCFVSLNQRTKHQKMTSVAYFIAYCMEGELDEAKQLLMENPDMNISYENEKAFRTCCEYGHLRMAQWLFLKKPSINISASQDYAFRNACAKGHLHIVKWLIYVKPDINILAYNNVAFIDACLNSRLYVAQYLYSINPLVVNHYCAYNDDTDEGKLFRDLCVDARLEVAKWLYEVNPKSFQEGDHLPFILSCEFGHYHVARWIQKIRPYKYVIHHMCRSSYGGPRYSINTDEEYNWQKRKYLVWLASNKCPNKNKKSIIHNLPFDVARYLIGFV